MKFKDILEDIKIDSQEYLNEAIVSKSKKYYVVKNHNKEECVPGTKESGYASLDNAVRAMMDQTNSDFKALDFERKKQRVDNYIKRWKRENNIEDKKPKRKVKHGFEEIKFTTD